MDIGKYRIRKRGGKWHVFAPGWAFTPTFTGRSFRHCVNAVPYVCEAPAGLLTYLEMPLVAGRADLARHRSRR